ncbi:uncharacterized protein TNCV_442371 [Trichonephila clavipes]|nr:uncharacterized protein TNCV_442371 [Trichonephila clavipes]
MQQLKPEDCGKRTNYATLMLKSIADETMADRLIFSNESTFHISVEIKRYSIQLWGTKRPYTEIEHELES